jgi:DNA-binding NarL/FixJ family response regulator
MTFREHGQLDFISILVADSTRIHTQLLADAIGKDPGLKVVATATASNDLRESVQRFPVDVLILSYQLDNQSGRGSEVLLELRALRPQIKGIMLLDNSDPEVVLDCFRAGAKGIFSKDERLETLCKCIRTVHDGQIWARSIELEHALETLASSPRVRARNQKGIELLSARERQVIEYVAAGMTNREIAKALDLSPHTVKNYLCKIFDKMGASSRTELLYLTMNQAPESASKTASVPVFDLSEAAEAGNPWAQFQLAESLNEPGTPQYDPVLARMWYLVAKERAATLLSEIQESLQLGEPLSREQEIEAEDRAQQILLNRRRSTLLESQSETAEINKGGH